MSSESKLLKIIWIGCAILFGGIFFLGNVLNVPESLVGAFGWIVGVVVAFMGLREVLRDEKHDR